jgi:hypothetical protein
MRAKSTEEYYMGITRLVAIHLVASSVGLQIARRAQVVLQTVVEARSLTTPSAPHRRWPHALWLTKMCANSTEEYCMGITRLAAIHLVASSVGLRIARRVLVVL